jgi:hypothetical protein
MKYPRKRDADPAVRCADKRVLEAGPHTAFPALLNWRSSCPCNHVQLRASMMLKLSHRGNQCRSQTLSRGRRRRRAVRDAGREARRQGRAVQVDPIKPTLKAPEIKRLVAKI